MSLLDLIRRFIPIIILVLLDIYGFLEGFIAQQDALDHILAGCNARQGGTAVVIGLGELLYGLASGAGDGDGYAGHLLVVGSVGKLYLEGEPVVLSVQREGTQQGQQ